MKIKRIVLLISIFIASCSSNKNYLQEAAISSDKGQYEDALFSLKKSFDLTPDEATGRKIANTYFNLRDFNQAEFWYKWIRENSEFSISDYYMLTQILIGNSKYAEAKLLLEDLVQIEENEISTLRWQNLARITFEAPDLLKSKNNKDVQPFYNLNTPFSDFGYSSFNEKKYFLSNRVNNDLEDKGKSKNYIESILNPFFKIYEFDMLDLTQIQDSISVVKSNILESDYHLGPIFINDSIFAYTYTSNKSITTNENLKLLNPQIKFYQNDKEVKINKSRLNDYFITDPFYSASQNRIYFSANFNYSLGGLDIYYVENIEGDKWSAPINCGPNINSFGDERSPFIFNDVFYFSSNGRGGLGGFDIFKSSVEFLGSKPPTNMGIPYNSSKDDLFYFIDGFSNDLEVITSDRDGGVGFDDIYYIINKDNLSPLKKSLRVIDLFTKTPLYNTVIALDSNNIYYTDSIGYSAIPNIIKDSVITLYKDNYFTKKINVSQLALKDSLTFELEKIDINKSFAYFGIDSLISTEIDNEKFNKFLNRSILTMKENPEFQMEFSVHSDTKNITYFDKLTDNLKQFIINKGDFSDRISFIYLSNNYPLVNKNIDDYFLQKELNNRLEFKLIKKNNFKSSYSYPHYYLLDSTFLTLISPENTTDKIPDTYERFGVVSEFRPKDKIDPTFSIVVGSFDSQNKANAHKETLLQKFPELNINIIKPTLISNQYRVSVYNSRYLVELKQNIFKYYEKLKIKDIWILEH